MQSGSMNTKVQCCKDLLLLLLKLPQVIPGQNPESWPLDYNDITNLVFTVTYAPINTCRSNDQICKTEDNVAWPNTKYKVPSILKSKPKP